MFKTFQNTKAPLWERLPQIPPELLVKILKERLNFPDCIKKGWVLEGIPQTREQALCMQENGIFPKHCGKLS